MTKLWAACLAVAVAVSVGGCGPAITPSERPLFSNGSNTITFLVFDALTGAGIENATVKFTVGTYELPVSKQSGNAYIVSQVPFGTHLATFDAAGYVGYVGQPQGTSNSTLTGPSSQTYSTYQVALYPQQGVNDDVVVKAFESDKGTAVASGTVVATLTGASSVGVGFANPLPGSLALRPSTVTATLIEGGSATLPKDKLVLGGAYTLNLFGARTSAGAYLAPAENVAFTAGKSFPQLTIFMGPPAQLPIALNANNETVAVYPNLQVNFPFPVEICSDPATHTWTKTVGSDGNTDGVQATPATTNPVTAALSADGGKLTVTPNFATVMATGASTFQPADGLQEIVFNNIKLKVKGTSMASCTALTSIKLRTSGAGPVVSTTLRIAAAP